MPRKPSAEPWVAIPFRSPKSRRQKLDDYIADNYRTLRDIRDVPDLGDGAHTLNGLLNLLAELLVSGKVRIDGTGIQRIKTPKKK